MIILLILWMKNKRGTLGHWNSRVYQTANTAFYEKLFFMETQRTFTFLAFFLSKFYSVPAKTLVQSTLNTWVVLWTQALSKRSVCFSKHNLNYQKVPLQNHSAELWICVQIMLVNVILREIIRRVSQTCMQIIVSEKIFTD